MKPNRYIQKPVLIKSYDSACSAHVCRAWEHLGTESQGRERVRLALLKGSWDLVTRVIIEVTILMLAFNSN